MNHKQDLLKLSLTVANLLFIEQLYSLILIPSRSIKLNGYRRKNVTRFTTCLSNFTNVYILQIVNTIKFIKMQSKINKPTVTELHQGYALYFDNNVNKIESNYSFQNTETYTHIALQCMQKANF